ncbi:hypothetical protein [Desertihabitans brevis]|uniref:hypothetical protein n=1 Tax=Desertihabitans brevis TaxID=2268447 RepID=UPI0011BFCE5A|nr:hypothetical protein [Desertihabitans brevis]
MSERTYFRSQDGRRWHRSTCPNVRAFMPRWKWAEGFSGAQIVLGLIANGLIEQVVPCRRCKPEDTP